MKVLVVDDSMTARKITIRALKQIDDSLEFTEAKDAASGLAAFEADEFDLAMIDFNMPGEDGMWLCERIQGANRGVKTVLCTANTQQALQARADKLSVPVVHKPLSAEKVSAFVAGG